MRETGARVDKNKWLVWHEKENVIGLFTIYNTIMNKTATLVA